MMSSCTSGGGPIGAAGAKFMGVHRLSVSTMQVLGKGITREQVHHKTDLQKDKVLFDIASKRKHVATCGSKTCLLVCRT